MLTDLRSILVVISPALLVLLWIAIMVSLVVATIRQGPWKWSFSLSHAMLLTFVVAAVCAVIRVLMIFSPK